MLAIAFYLLKVIICSGILYGYYLLALRNKVFHLWNRFYLLSAVLISLVLPVITIHIERPAEAPTDNIVQLLNVVKGGEIFLNEVVTQNKVSISSEQVIPGLYAGICVLLLLWTVRAFIHIRTLAKKYPIQKFDKIYFVNTDERGTPFSFFKYIFWNQAIDPQSDTGTKIFKHELVHVKELHSADRIFMNLVLCLFWVNPFFWLIRREMNMIHEFIADSKSVEDYDRSSFATMILQAAYPQHSFGLTSSFFSSSIKRRLMMLAKMENKKVSYVTRVLVLPLITFVFMSFALKIQQSEEAQDIQRSSFHEPVNLLMEEGPVNKNKVNISTEGEYVKDFKTEKTGNQQTSDKKIDQQPNLTYAVKNAVAGRADTIEVHDAKNVSEKLLKQKDTIPGNVKSVDITKDDNVIVIYKNGKAEKISKEQAIKRKLISLNSNIELSVQSNISTEMPSNILYILDGKEISEENFKALNKNEIASMSVWKGDKAVEKFGQKGSKGVIEIETKSYYSKTLSEVRLIAYDTESKWDKSQTEPQFPGGDKAWARYISRSLNEHLDALQKNKQQGTCIVQFNIDTDGSISNVEALTMKNTKLAEIAIQAIKKGPKWIPGTKEGQKVRASHTQPVTFLLSNGSEN